MRTYWYTGISASHSFRAVHSEFCQTALLVILTIWQPHPHCHTQLVPLQTFPHLAVLGCASHDFPELITLIVCIRLTLFGVLANSLQGVTPSFEISVMQFSKTTFIKLFVTLGYAFVGYSHRFRRRTCHTVRKLVQDNGLTDYEQLAQKATEAADRFHAISEQIKQTEQAMKTNAGLKAATVQYAKTRPVFEQYKATKYSRKFRNFWGSSFALRRLSDRLCLENGLSIVENPKPRSKGKYRNYGEWQKERKGPLSYQDRLRLAIDTALAERPADLDEFLGLMKRAGYEVKKVRGGGISFRLTGQGQERFTRLRASTLGDGYDLKDVLAAIEGKEKRPGHPERKISLAVDIQAKLAAGKGPGYERWAKVFNIKQMAAALAYIQDNGLTDYEQLAQKATEATDHFHALSEQIKQTEQAMKTNAGLKAATVQYAKTRPVFEQYKATKYSRKFLAEHEADIELYRAAQAEMRRLLGGAKLPKMDALKEESRKLTAKKKRLYGEYQKARRDMQEIVTIKVNIDTLLGYTEPGRKQEKER